MKRRLEEIAIVHSGDKGDTCNIGVVPYDMALAGWLRANLTASLFEELFAGLVEGPVSRYELPGSGCLNFVIERALDGGVTRSLGIDGHGKSWSYLAGTIELDMPADLAVGVGIDDGSTDEHLPRGENDEHTTVVVDGDRSDYFARSRGLRGRRGSASTRGDGR